jgi:RNA polymerase sigma-54 factor
MALIPRLDLRQSQSLVMTPQLQQAIKLLQFSSLDLLDYVEKELEENPLLERDEGDDGEQIDPLFDGGELSEEIAEIGLEDGGLDVIDFNNPEKDSENIVSDMDVDIDNEWNTDKTSETEIVQASLAEPAFSDSGTGGAIDFMGALPNLEETITEKTSLRERLNSQMVMSFVDPIEKLIGTQLIDTLDDSGYVSGDLKYIAESLECTTELVEKVLFNLQGIDIPGLFARNLSECLALQLREIDRLDPAMQALLDNLELLAKRDVSALIEICGVDAEDIADMFIEIKKLNPRPAQAFEDTIMQPIVPDVIMRFQTGSGWIVELNSETLPKVLVNNTYLTTIASANESKEDKRYINECYQSANWLVKSLHQRATTILKVASEIVRQQDAFFAKGVQYLRPLVLRDIADVIDMHESTVSRVTSNKFISSPRGIFELKYFFTAAISSSSGGDTYSSESVRHRIKSLVNQETIDKILSDDKIVNLLNAEGIDVARRTVAKYREALGLASSVQRRREKKSGL